MRRCAEDIRGKIESGSRYAVEVRKEAEDIQRLAGDKKNNTGSRIGELRIIRGDETVSKIPAVAFETVEKKGFFEYLGDIFSGLLR